MVTSRLPQLTALSTSSTAGPKFRRVTKNMISSPVSPSFNGGLEAIPSWHTPALEYISRKLQDKYVHITLIISRSTSNLNLIPASPLDAKTRMTFSKVILKASQKFAVGKQWLDALSYEPFDACQSSYLRRRSLLQNEILFSSEGLTLLNIDHVYTFKQHLSILSSSTLPLWREDNINTCIHHLHRITATYGGRPLTKAYILRAYDHLHLNEDVLQQVCAAYETKYGHIGIVLASKNSESPKPEPAKTFPRFSSAKVGPMTPNSASDITPITKNEWEMLITLQC
ncbi:MAG: hypothetical protein M1830_002408 [Pleopsidium flavum]|nr:MAG: hypothetical protein M1830_002408 [Pleopsidium flavum]